MGNKIIEKIFGTHSDREIKKIIPIVDQIEALEEEYKALSDEQLKAKTPEFKKRLKDGETLDDILPEAFATIREASWRVLGMRPFRVQLIGGIVLHQGRISEMKTGEGKTLVATLPVYLNALTGEGVHVVTVNDYLAKRDSEWMGKVYQFLGLTVGLVVNEMDNDERRYSYGCDITYGTNNEFGFDYLRDNMVTYKEEMVQRKLKFAIVDEVDSILIDEARTPLIISGQGDKSTDLYKQANTLAMKMRKKVIVETDSKDFQDFGDADYVVDEKAKSVTLTDAGAKRAEEFFGVENINDIENTTLLHHINQAIRAHGIMKLDIDYVVKDGEVIIVDEFTGRLMIGRRYSEGLHQAIEAKEGVKVERESKTLATITFQNYFRMYEKLSGMTGTALTEEMEFREIYGLDVIVIPTNREVQRIDMSDVVYQTETAKFNAVVEDVAECHAKGQPVLIGTISIEKSEQLSKLLKRRGIPHQVLNAKQHAREAEIVAQAGKFGAVTIATNMAGRGTDIVLGGNPEYMAKLEMRKKGFSDELILEADSHNDTTDEELLKARAAFKEYNAKFVEEFKDEKQKVLDAGGLFIMGTERHESRRIDNQLRGRSGRQGDPGASRFYISLEDDLMRLFGSDRMKAVVSSLGMKEDEQIEHKMLSNAIENAQKRVEGRNFNIRKHVIQYDDVMNQQREIIYAERRKVLDGEDMKSYFENTIESVVESIVATYIDEKAPVDEWDFRGINRTVRSTFGLKDAVSYDESEYCRLDKFSVRDDIVEQLMKIYEAKEAEVTPELMREVERVILLRAVDEKWMDHIDDMDQLKEGINLRAYGNHDPVMEYKFEGLEMFENMVASIKEDAVNLLFSVNIDPEKKVLTRKKVAEPTMTSLDDSALQEGIGDAPTQNKTIVKSNKVGRNEPCPCGSGKKYKNCCGA